MKRILKKIYYSSRDTAKKIRNTLSPTAVILAYHRVAFVNNDPHRLCVSPDNFERQIDFLSANFRIISLEKLATDIKNGGLNNHSLSVTFDDGYADNLENALPILGSRGVPVTFFVVSGQVGSKEPFYWHKGLDSQDAGRALTPDELLLLSRNKEVEIGAHTISHPNLSKISPAEQFREISGSKIDLEKILGGQIKAFAYPFGSKGSFSRATIAMVKKCGFEYACANIHRRATNRSNIFTLPRYVVRDWSLEEFKTNLKKFI